MNNTEKILFGCFINKYWHKLQTSMRYTYVCGFLWFRSKKLELSLKQNQSKLLASFVFCI